MSFPQNQSQSQAKSKSQHMPYTEFSLGTVPPLQANLSNVNTQMNVMDMDMDMDSNNEMDRINTKDVSIQDLPTQANDSPLSKLNEEVINDRNNDNNNDPFVFFNHGNNDYNDGI
eukprot:191213_1